MTGSHMTQRGYAARVLAEIAGLDDYVCGCSTETDCMTAIASLYPHDRIRVTLTPLSHQAVGGLSPPLRQGEVRRAGG